MADLQKCVSGNNYHEGCAVTEHPVAASPSDKIDAVHRGNLNKDWSVYTAIVNNRFKHPLYYETGA